MSNTETTVVETRRSQRKEREGVVVSDAADKTISVLVERRTAHPLYKKVVKTRRRYCAHDENNDANVGDRVRIVETRPLSKRKHWRLVEIITRAHQG